MFIVEYHRNGTIVRSFKTGGGVRGIIGLTVNGKPHAPLMDDVILNMDKRLKPAISCRWWSMDKLCSDVMRKDLVGSKGQPLGTLIARLEA